MKKSLLIAGIALMTLGTFLYFYSGGTRVMTATYVWFDKGIRIEVQRPFLFATYTVAQGGTYEVRVKVTNVGSVTWDWWQITFRIGVNGAGVTTTTESGVAGSYYVETCSSGVNVPACREDLTAWSFQYSYDGSSWNTGCPNYKDRVCVLSPGGSLKPGESKTIYLRIKVPSTAAAGGKYPAIYNAVAGSVTWTPQVAIQASVYDTLSVVMKAPVGTGVISTELVAIALSTIGFMLMLAGVVL